MLSHGYLVAHPRNRQWIINMTPDDPSKSGRSRVSIHLSLVTRVNESPLTIRGSSEPPSSKNHGPPTAPPSGVPGPMPNLRQPPGFALRPFGSFVSGAKN